jgi:hypothetical protein
MNTDELVHLPIGIGPGDHRAPARRLNQIEPDSGIPRDSINGGKTLNPGGDKIRHRGRGLGIVIRL